MGRGRRGEPCGKDDQFAATNRAVPGSGLAAGQGELDLGLEVTDAARQSAGGGPLSITSSRMGHLLDALEHPDRVLGFEGYWAGAPESCGPAEKRHARS